MDAVRPYSAHFACAAYSDYSACLAVGWWWWVGLFIQLHTDPEWILTVAGHFYIYDHNPVTGPPFSSSISSFLLPTSASSSDSHWRLLPPAQPSCCKGKTALLLWLTCVIFYLLTATCRPKGHGSSLPLPSRTVVDFP